MENLKPDIEYLFLRYSMSGFEFSMKIYSHEVSVVCFVLMNGITSHALPVYCTNAL